MKGSAGSSRCTVKCRILRDQINYKSFLLQGKSLGVFSLAAQQILIEATGLLDDAQGKLLIHGLVIIAKLVLGLAIRSFVVTEPCPDLVNLSRELPAIHPG